jgi:hypothetical protein
MKVRCLKCRKEIDVVDCRAVSGKYAPHAFCIPCHDTQDWMETDYEVKVNFLIDDWHLSQSKASLAEYLHLTSTEYAAFVEGKLSYEWVWEFYNERKNRRP